MSKARDLSKVTLVLPATTSTLGTVFGATYYDTAPTPFPKSTAIGYQSLPADSTLGLNVAVGTKALNSITTGNQNTAVGELAGKKLTTSQRTVVIGYLAGQDVTTGTFNTLVGAEAGYGLKTGNYNTFVGADAGYNLWTGSHNIAIGTYSELSSISASNEAVIGAKYNGPNTNDSGVIHRLTISGMSIDWYHVISDSTSLVASAPSATTYYELIADRNVRYHTVNATNNWILNLRGSDVITYDSISLVNKAVTIVFMNTNGATAYYPTAFQIDGTACTVKWQGGTAPTAGNANSVDVYTYTIIKTASNTYTVLGSQTKFA